MTRVGVAGGGHRFSQHLLCGYYECGKKTFKILCEYYAKVDFQSKSIKTKQWTTAERKTILKHNLRDFPPREPNKFNTSTTMNGECSPKVVSQTK